MHIFYEFASVFPNVKLNAQLHYIDHHLSHLASAHFVSPFETSFVASIDGFGDFASGAWGIGTKNNINLQKRALFPHSMGIFYRRATQFIGFPNYGDEYKMMGLAPYGKPLFLKEMKQIVKLYEDGSYH